MNPGLSRRVGRIMVSKTITSLEPDELNKLIEAAKKADTFDDLPEDIQTIILEAEKEMSVAKITKEGYIIKSDAKKRYTLGVVYEPGVVDSQDEWSDEEEIEKACWNFMRYLQGKSRVNKSVLELLDLIVKGLEERYAAAIDISDIWEDIQKAVRGLGYMHAAWGDDIGDIVECYIAPADLVINGEYVQKGTWLMGVVWSPEYFKKVEKGEITGFSMGGRGRRIYE